MPSIYTASVVGAGMGGKLSIKALSASDRFQLAAVTDLREDVRREVEAQFPDVRTFATHQAMFAECPTDVVCIATWPPSHLEVTRAALELPLKGILVEKPLADNTVDGGILVDLIRNHNLPLVVPHGLLVATHSRQIIDRVQSGQIGELKLVEIECTGWDIINAGIHWLDFVVALTGNEPADFVLAACDATTRTYRDGMQVETQAVTYVQMRSGLRVVMHTGDSVKTSEPGEGVLFRLIGTMGTLDFYGWKSRYRLCNTEYPQGQIFDIDPGRESNHLRYLHLLADQMDHGQPDYTWAEYSLAALELCEAAYLSSKHRCAVNLPLSTFAPPPPTNWEPGQPYRGVGGGRDGRKLP